MLSPNIQKILLYFYTKPRLQNITGSIRTDNLVHSYINEADCAITYLQI